MATLLARRDLIGQANEVKTSLSSWDGCMSKAYCKWPVISVMIIAGLIVFSILWCFIRCLCCGAECACCCFRCCAGCCGSKRKDKGHKHLDSAPPTPYHQPQYQSPPHPVYGVGGSAFSQTATFDASHGKPVHEDSLPAMPSWENAPSKKVEVWEEAESHEMDRLKGNESPALSGFAADPPRPGMGARNGSGHTVTTAASLPSPRLPDAYGYNAGQVSHGDSLPSPRLPDAYGYNAGQASHGDSHTGYRGAAPVPAPLPAQMGGYRSRSPGNGGYGGGVQRNDYGDSSRLPPARSPVYAPYQGDNGSNVNQSSSTVGYGGGRSPYGNYGGYGGQPDGGRDRRPAPQGSWRDI